MVDRRELKICILTAQFLQLIDQLSSTWAIFVVLTTKANGLGGQATIGQSPSEARNVALLYCKGDPVGVGLTGNICLRITLVTAVGSRKSCAFTSGNDARVLSRCSFSAGEVQRTDHVELCSGDSGCPCDRSCSSRSTTAPMHTASRTAVAAHCSSSALLREDATAPAARKPMQKP